MTKNRKKLTQIAKKTKSVEPTILTNPKAKIGNKKLTFSFEFFTKNHELFNLGDKTETIGGPWFVSLMEGLQYVSTLTVPEAQINTRVQLHGINWETSNANPPSHTPTTEFHQFRLNKSTGRVIGFLVGSLFYIVWLDPHHNLTDSKGYGKAVVYNSGYTDYELLQKELLQEKENNKDFNELLAIYEEQLKNI